MADRVVELHREDEFRSFTEQWDACLRSMPDPSPFLTSAWLLSWWRVFGSARQMRVVMVLDAHGDIRAAAPLLQQRAYYYGVPVREMTFLGDSTSDRQQFLLQAGDEAALETLWCHLRRLSPSSDILRLEELPEESATLTVGRNVCPELRSEPSSILPYLSIQGGWEDYESRLSSKFCRELRSRPKVFSSWGKWAYERITGASVVEHLNGLAALETASAKATAGYAFLANSANVSFMRSFLLTASSEIDPWLSLLRIDGEIIAYLLGFVHRNVYHAYNMAYAPGREKGSPGKWVFHRTIKQAFEAGLTGFDFLRGQSYVKSKWRPVARQNVRAVLFYPGIRSRCLASAVFVVRPWLKKHMGRWRQRESE